MIQLLVVDNVAVLELNDAENFNSFSPDLGYDMQSAVEFVQALPEVSAMTMQGSGPHFSIGGNPYAMKRAASASWALDVFAASIRGLYSGFLRLRTMAIPVACAVHGTVVGGGLAACLHADCICAERMTSFEHGAPSSVSKLSTIVPACLACLR